MLFRDLPKSNLLRGDNAVWNFLARNLRAKSARVRLVRDPPDREPILGSLEKNLANPRSDERKSHQRELKAGEAQLPSEYALTHVTLLEVTASDHSPAPHLPTHLVIRGEAKNEKRSFFADSFLRFKRMRRMSKHDFSGVNGGQPQAFGKSRNEQPERESGAARPRGSLRGEKQDQRPAPDLKIRMANAAGVVERITGERPSVATIYRWADKGLRGVRLQTAYAGGHLRTTERWIVDFFDEVTAAHDGPANRSVSSSSSAQRRQQAAEQRLADDGI